MCFGGMLKKEPQYFFIITYFIIFITDNTLLYYKPLVGDIVAKIVIPTERSDETLVRQCLQQLVTRSAGEVCAV